MSVRLGAIPGVLGIACSLVGCGRVGFDERPDAGAGFAGLINGSFEADFTAWTTTGNQTIKATGFYIPTDGAQLAAFNDGDTAPDAVLAQTFATVPGTAYTLSFDFGVVVFGSAMSQQVRLEVTSTTLVLGEDLAMTLGGTEMLRWEPQEFSFTADGDSTTLTFRDDSADTVAVDALLDHIRITAM